MIDLPPAVVHHEISQQCVMVTARSFNISPLLLGGLLMVEGGRNGMANKNTNGSYDYGIAQINSAWLPKTKGVGVGVHELKNDSCKNLWAAAWILRRCLNKFSNSFWHGVGCYHTGENPKSEAQLGRQKTYAIKVYNATRKIKEPFTRWLSQR